MSCLDDFNVANTSKTKGKEDSFIEENEETDESMSDCSDNETDSDLNVQEEESESHNETNPILGDLKSMPFEDLMKLKQKLGSKIYNEVIFGTTEKRNTRKVFKRENSNRPMEISSKKQVPFGACFKSKTENPIADPRFNVNCGDFDSTKFKKQYDFINDMRLKELGELKKNLQKSDDPEETVRIKFLIQRLKNQLHEEERRKEKLVKKDKLKKEMNTLKGDNKKTFYVKPNLKKTEEMVKQYEELKKSGKLQKHLEKRRKKSLVKDRKKFIAD